MHTLVIIAVSYINIFFVLLLILINFGLARKSIISETILVKIGESKIILHVLSLWEHSFNMNFPFAIKLVK